MKAVYPGSFDPITTGHIDIIKRAMKFCDELIILVAENSRKKTFFSVDERISFIKKATDGLKNVSVQSYAGLTVEFSVEHGTTAMIRSVRSLIDFESELNLAAINKSITEHIETILLVANPSLAHVSSSAVKELALYGSDLTGYIPDVIKEEIVKKLYAINSGGKMRG
jgi:pantetheine-phosphate adenylyltransferase